ncbi:MAG: KTSC domain-containing protein [Chitinophagaceae bacterium]|nr:MAG: KTSC domain-containing protein [Chitinophagaceae bacterium]
MFFLFLYLLALYVFTPYYNDTNLLRLACLSGMIYDYKNVPGAIALQLMAVSELFK